MYFTPIKTKNQSNRCLQYCAKEMQTKFVEIRSFSWLFDEKIANLRSARICCENSLKFAVPIVFNVANFRTLNSLALKIDFESSSENSSSSINDFESSSKLFVLFRSFFAIATSMVSTAANIVPTGLTLNNQLLLLQTYLVHTEAFQFF